MQGMERTKACSSGNIYRHGKDWRWVEFCRYSWNISASKRNIGDGILFRVVNYAEILKKAASSGSRVEAGNPALKSVAETGVFPLTTQH